MAVNEQKDKEVKGIVISVVIHALFLLLFFFITVFKAQDPPLSGMAGADINFGFDSEGSGDNNSMDQATDNQEHTEQADNAQAAEEAAAPEEVLSTTNVNADNVVPDTKKTSTSQTATNTTQNTSPNTNKNTSTSKPGGTEGQGTSNTTGNFGKPDGTLEGQGLYPGNGGNGTGGNGNNSALTMDGWHLDAEPKVDNAEKEAGKVTFTVKIDSEGNILGIKVGEKQVSEALIKKCEDEIRKMEFIRNKTNRNPSETFTGVVTFVFRKT